MTWLSCVKIHVNCCIRTNNKSFRLSGTLLDHFTSLGELGIILKQQVKLLTSDRSFSFNFPVVCYKETESLRNTLQEGMPPSKKKPRLVKEEKPTSIDSFEDDKQSNDTKKSLKTPADAGFGFGARKPLNEAGFKEFLHKVRDSKLSFGSSIEDCKFNEKRTRSLNGIPAVKSGAEYQGVAYWMSRDQRIDDNWALLCAQKFALKHECPLYVIFCLVPKFLDATIRHFDFILKGLQNVEKQCQTLQIDFHLLMGYPKDVLPEFVQEQGIGLVVTDFSPLRVPQQWYEDIGILLKKQDVPFYQVDAHNIVPCWVTSNKLEFAARTIRPKIHNNLKEFLTEIPPVIKHPHKTAHPASPVDWDEAYNSLEVDQSVPPITWAQPGTIHGYRMLYEFITQRLKNYEQDRNVPIKHGLSCLSPYYHFGQLSVQRVILAITDKEVKAKAQKSVDAYVEEAVVRRELSDNFCYYQQDYDNLNGAWDWAKKTISEHRKDKREYLYNRDELEFGKTHDKLWNAAQIQMIREGKMHGYIRMYWAKKILEWTHSVEEALETAIYLNDRYEIDGRDPNGYVGCMWSIVGVHDRAWTERPIFGKIRFMNYNGCVRKFDVEGYARHYKSL